MASSSHWSIDPTGYIQAIAKLQDDSLIPILTAQTSIIPPFFDSAPSSYPLRFQITIARDKYNSTSFLRVALLRQQDPDTETLHYWGIRFHVPGKAESYT